MNKVRLNRRLSLINLTHFVAGYYGGMATIRSRSGSSADFDERLSVALFYELWFWSATYGSGMLDFVANLSPTIRRLASNCKVFLSRDVIRPDHFRVARLARTSEMETCLNWQVEGKQTEMDANSDFS